MTNREDVIQELKEGIEFAYHRCHCGLAVTMENAVELLKAQRPRLLTIEEVKALEKGAVVWVEENYGGDQIYLSPMISSGDGFFGNYYWGIDLNLFHEKKRFWTAKPTREQLATTPWKEE